MRTLLIFCLSCLIVSCSQNKESVNSKEKRECDFEEWLERIEFPDTIVGCFNGIKLDTLTIVPLDTVTIDDFGDLYDGWHYRWLVKSSNHSVEDFEIGGTIAVRFVSEGDLDGDGGDEFGYVTDWPTSNWMQYHIFTYKNGQWMTLINPTTVWLPHIDNTEDFPFTAEDIARPSTKKGQIHIRFSDVRNDGEDFLFIDTIVRVNPRPVKWGE